MKKQYFFSKAAVCALLSLVFGNSLLCCGQESDSSSQYIDRDRFPEAYSILTSDHIMFPGDVTDWPMKIDSKRQLFVDDYVISSVENLTRRFHQPVKHPKNPLVIADRPWESEIPDWIYMAFALYDPVTNKFQMWYHTEGRTMYAESDDGITWRKPNLGMVEYKGSRENNILSSRVSHILKFDPHASNPQKRYTAVVDGYLSQSSDGLHWTADHKRPALGRTMNSMSPGPYWSKGIGDTSIYRYDPILERYICDAKFNLYMPKEKIKQLGITTGNKPRLKLRTMVESENFIHWTRQRFIMYPDRNDDPDCQIYQHISFVYESMWLGMVRLMHIIPTGFKQVDVQLSYSRDGRHWNRPRQRKLFIPLGEPDSWEPDYTDPSSNGPLLVNDELWFYYRGSRHAKRDDPDYVYRKGKLPRSYKMAFGLAKLRRDGFVSLDTDDTPGQVVTRPLTFAGKKLFVNADVEKDGWVKAAVLTRDSNSIDSYKLDDSVTLTKDTTKGRMSWKSKRELVPPGDKHLRLVFQLKNAKLYSFWIE